MNTPLPTPLATYPELVPWVEAQWRAHIDDGFHTLAQIPSGGVRTHCAVLRDDPALASIDALMAHAMGLTTMAERGRLAAQAMALGPALGDGPVFLRKAFLSEAIRRTADESERALLTAELAGLAGIDTPKAADVRKAINAALKAQFGKTMTSEGGGNWSLSVEVNAATIILDVDTGGMSRGFKYWFRPPRRPGTIMPAWLAYETLLGLPGTAWDLLRTDRLDSDIALWSRNLASLHDAMRAVRWTSAL